MAIFLRETEKQGGGGGEGGRKSLPFSLRVHISPLFFYPLRPRPPLPRVWCFIGERSRELFPFLPSISSPPLPSGPDEINDGINDTALNAGDQPVNRLDRFHPRVPTFRPK